MKPNCYMFSLQIDFAKLTALEMACFKWHNQAWEKVLLSSQAGKFLLIVLILLIWAFNE